MSDEITTPQDKIVQALQEAGIDTERPGRHLLIATDPRAHAALQLIAQAAIKQQPANRDIDPQNVVVGSFSVCVVPNPRNWHDTQSYSAHWLDFTFDGVDWYALFHIALGVPEFEADATAEARTVEEGGAASQAQEMERFRPAVPEYPMLGRFYSMYEDVAFRREEIEQLREECVRAQSATENPEAWSGLVKLITACDEALKLNMGLFFACQ